MYSPDKENLAGKKIAIIGSGHNKWTALSRAPDGSLSCKDDKRMTVTESNSPSTEDLYWFKRYAPFDEPWIDPHEPVFNYRKQEQSFAKNRRVRKKRNRKK